MVIVLNGLKEFKDELYAQWGLDMDGPTKLLERH